jgi:hypothetical protein
LSVEKISQDFEGIFYFLRADQVLKAKRTARPEKIKNYPKAEEIFNSQPSDQRERSRRNAARKFLED